MTPRVIERRANGDRFVEVVRRHAAVAPLILATALPLSAFCRGESSNDELNSQAKQVSELIDQGEFDAAIPRMERLIESLEKAEGTRSLNIARGRVRLAALHAKVGSHELAEQQFLLALGIYEDAGQASEEYADALAQAGSFFRQMDKRARAVELLQKAFDIKQADANTDQVGLAAVSMDLARCYLDRREFGKAIPPLQQVIEFERKRSGAESDSVAALLATLGMSQHKARQLHAAKRTFEQCLAIHENRFALFWNHEAVALMSASLAEVLYDLGDYADAERVYRKALAAHEWRHGKGSAETVSPCRKIAECLLYRTEYAAAEEFAKRAVDTAREKCTQSDGRLAAAVDTLASVLRVQGKLADAQSLYELSLKMAEDLHGRAHRETATALLNLAVFYADQQQLEKARSAGEESLAIYRSLEPMDAVDIAVASHNLGAIYWNLGRHAEAEGLLREAVQDCEAHLGPQHPYVATMLTDLAINAFFLKRYAEGKDYATRAIEISKVTFGPDHPSATPARVALGVIQAAQNEWNVAARALGEGMQSLVKQINRLLPALAAQEQIAFMQAGPSRPYNALLSMALLDVGNNGVCDQSAACLINMKALGHEALAVNSFLQRQARNPEEAARASRLHDVRQQLAALVHAAPSGNGADAHAEDLRRLEARERDLIHEVGGQLAAVYRAGSWVDVDAVRKQLQPNEILVDYARVRIFDFKADSWPSAWKPDHYAAWIIPPSGAGRVRVLDLGSADHIDGLISSYREEMRSSLGAGGAIATKGEKAAESILRQKGRALAKAIFDPVESAIRDKPGQRKIETVVIGPDSNLWLVPWAALPDEEARYIVERYDLLTVTSARDLLRNGFPGEKQGQAVVFADPDYDLAQSAKAARHPTKARRIGPVRRLPASADEAALVRPVLAGITKAKPVTYTGADATETAAKALRGPRIVHFATHGFFLADQHFALDQGDFQTRTAELPAISKSLITGSGELMTSPFLRSGLMLAGCNVTAPAGPQSADDGVLTGMEVLGMDLSGTELAVLSACETGIGEIHCGEGVAGLRQAFLVAGADAVLATLWLVEDRSTTEMVASFMGEWESCASPVVALARAQRTAIAEGRRSRQAAHPVYWGAFELTQ